MKIFKIKTFICFLAISVIMCCSGCSVKTNAENINVCVSDRYVTKTVKTEDFHSIRTASSIDIEYTVGPRKVEIYAPDNLIEYIAVNVANDVLQVKYNVKRIQINGRNKAVVRVSAPDVTEFMTGSSGDIDIKSAIKSSSYLHFITRSSGDITAGTITAPEVIMTTQSSGDIEATDVNCTSARLKTQSSGDIKINIIKCDEANIATQSSGDIKIEKVNAATVKASTQSSGDIKLKGNCQTALLTTQSSGDISAESLKARDTTAKCLSSGDIRCYASESLTVSCPSVGSVGYSGNPKKIKNSSQGIYELD